MLYMHIYTKSHVQLCVKSKQIIESTAASAMTSMKLVHQDIEVYSLTKTGIHEEIARTLHA